jgi:acyl carrier protein
MTTQEETPEGIARELASYLAEEMLVEDSPVDPDRNLLVEGIVDSLGLLRIVGHLERAYDLKIPPEDYVIDNFRSLNTIGRYVQRLRSEGVR